MRKNYVEKYRFYKLLEDLTETPDSATSPVYYLKKVDEVELEIMDFFCYFIRDRKAQTFQICFFCKPKLARVGLSSIPIYQGVLSESQFLGAIFNDSILYMVDALKFLLGDCVQYTQSLSNALDNYEIAKRY